MEFYIFKRYYFNETALLSFFGGVEGGTPKELHARGFDGNLACLFFGRIVCDSCAVVHATSSMDGIGDEEDFFGKGGFARIHVGNKTDVAEIA